MPDNESNLPWQATRRGIAETMGDIDGALPGSVVVRHMRCGKTGCSCKADPPALHGPYIQWTRTVDGKTVTKFLSDDQLASGVLRDASNPRERLSALLTVPQNERFAQVAANRLWKRLLEVGLVEPVDDWAFAKPSHPELMQFLAREFVTSGYDLKHLARLIFSSHAYQRRPLESLAATQLSPQNRLFAGPVRRKLTAEQLGNRAISGRGVCLVTLSHPLISFAPCKAIGHFTPKAARQKSRLKLEPIRGIGIFTIQRGDPYLALRDQIRIEKRR